MDQRQQLGVVGSVVLFGGAFAPILSVPFLGTMNYYQGDGKIVAVLAVLSLVLVLGKMYKGLWLSGGISLAIILYALVNYQRLGGLGRALVQLEWGWAPLVVGAGLILYTAAGKKTAPVQVLPVAAVTNKEASHGGRRGNEVLSILRRNNQEGCNHLSLL